MLTEIYPTLLSTMKMENATEIDYENPWYYKGTAFTSDDIDDLFGFVYRITNIQTGKQYIGGNTSGRKESLEVEVEGLRLRVTGKNTMEALRNLMKNEKMWGIIHSEEK